MRLLLLILAVFVASNSIAQFSSKVQALEYLNNNHIWVQGLPQYKLNHDKGILTITRTIQGSSYDVSFYLNDTEVEVKAGDTYTVYVNCKTGSKCMNLYVQGAKYAIEADRLVIFNTFDIDGSDIYKSQYPEKATKTGAAIDFLANFYR